MTSARRQRGDDRDLQELGEAQQLGRRPGAEDAAAGEDHRPLGRREQLDDGTDVGVGRRAPVRAGRHRRGRRSGAGSSSRSSGSESRTGPGRPPSAWRSASADGRCHVGGLARLGGPLGQADRSSRPGRSPGMPRDPGALARPGRRARTSGVESWRAVWMPIARLARADRARADARRGPAGQLPVRLGHERGAALVAGGDDPDPGVAERIEQPEERLAGDRERVADAGRAQGVGDEPADRPRSAAARSARARRRVRRGSGRARSVPVRRAPVRAMAFRTHARPAGRRARAAQEPSASARPRRRAGAMSSVIRTRAGT